MTRSPFGRWLEGRALELALFRIVLCLVVLLSADVHAALADAARAHADRTWVVVAHRAVLLGAAAGLFGSRLGLAVVAVAGFYLLGFRQIDGPVHCHHLVWFAALLAASPSTDALSWRARAPHGSGAIYGFPLRVAAALLATIYFFPGFWKLWISGSGWLSGEVLRGHLYWKWTQSWDFVPLFRVDLLPGLLPLSGALVLLFELGAPLLFLVRRAWPLAVGTALVFHGGTALLLDIHFSNLWPFLVVLVPLPLVPTIPDDRWPRATTVGVAGGLLLGAVGAGLLRSERSWPFACYPTFAEPVPLTMPALAVYLAGEAGDPRPIPLEAFMDPEPADWAEAWRLALHQTEGAEWRAWWDRTSVRPEVRALLPGAREVHIYRAELSVLPDRARRPEPVRWLVTLPLEDEPPP
jgi:hypothetical protein